MRSQISEFVNNTILYQRQTHQRNSAVFTADCPNLIVTEGFYTGYDLVPKALNEEELPKECQCGVSISLLKWCECFQLL